MSEDVLDDPVGKPFTLRDEIAELRAENTRLRKLVTHLHRRWSTMIYNGPGMTDEQLAEAAMISATTHIEWEGR